jgi:hypothetical protein
MKVFVVAARQGLAHTCGYGYGAHLFGERIVPLEEYLGTDLKWCMRRS